MTVSPTARNDVIFAADGQFLAMTPDCEAGDCTWWATDTKVFIEWGDAGLHEVEASALRPGRGSRLSGRRVRDGDRVAAVYVSGGSAEAVRKPPKSTEALGPSTVGASEAAAATGTAGTAGTSGKSSTAGKAGTAGTAGTVEAPASRGAVCAYIFKSVFESHGTSVDADIYRDTIKQGAVVLGGKSDLPSADSGADFPAVAIHVETIQASNVRALPKSLHVFMVNPDTGIPEVHSLEDMVTFFLRPQLPNLAAHLLRRS